ncbi:MAG TPA: hypothetical protein PKE05_10210 [Microthrixaceae bacterium]|nr:hypothetical protein [Microthrixaceae bacterium]
MAPTAKTATATAALMMEFLLMSAPQFVPSLEGGRPIDEIHDATPDLGRRPPDRPIPGSEPADLGEAYQSRGVDTLQVTMWLGPVTRGRNTDEIETRYTMSKTHSIPADPHTIVERTGSAADAAEKVAVDRAREARMEVVTASRER